MSQNPHHPQPTPPPPFGYTAQMGHAAPPMPTGTPRRAVPWGWTFGGAGVGLLLGAGVVGAIWATTNLASTAPSAYAQKMESAVSTCGIDVDDYYVSASDTFDSVTFDGVGRYASAVSFDDFNCFTVEIGMPPHIESEMGQTRALDGRQAAEWDGYTVTWSYHPDDGQNAVFAVRSTD